MKPTNPSTKEDIVKQARKVTNVGKYTLCYGLNK